MNQTNITIDSGFYNITESMQRDLEKCTAHPLALIPVLGSIPSVLRLLVSLGQYIVGKYNSDVLLIWASKKNSSDALFEMVPIAGYFVAAKCVSERANDNSPEAQCGRLQDQIKQLRRKAESSENTLEIQGLIRAQVELQSQLRLPAMLEVNNRKIRAFFDLSKEEQAKRQEEYLSWIEQNNLFNLKIGPRLIFTTEKLNN